MRYDVIWQSLANRAVKQAGVDAETFLEMAVNSGMAESEVERRLLGDLENNGPIFGKFLRSLTGAATSTVLAAERQGALAGTIDASAQLQRFTDLADAGAAIDDADPEALAQLADMVGPADFTWIATLVKTCYRCLPLHGKSFTMSEWEAMGYLPETMHGGWDSDCQCDLVPTDEAAGREDLMAPIIRNPMRDSEGALVSKRTVRAVTQNDLERAQKAVQVALQSEQGRKALQAAGQVME